MEDPDWANESEKDYKHEEFEEGEIQHPYDNLNSQQFAENLNDTQHVSLKLF